MHIKEIGKHTVCVEFRKKEDGEFDVSFDCGQGCECISTLRAAPDPTIKSAAERVICFHDLTHIGISGKGLPGRLVEQSDQSWRFEIEATLKKVVF